jgi:hypothetical protein
MRNAVYELLTYLLSLLNDSIIVLIFIVYLLPVSLFVLSVYASIAYMVRISKYKPFQNFVNACGCIIIALISSLFIFLLPFTLNSP